MEHNIQKGNRVVGTAGLIVFISLKIVTTETQCNRPHPLFSMKKETNFEQRPFTHAGYMGGTAIEDYQ